MRTEYVGLKNQGATCYLNSLVQALFMTPEFRNAIYNWKPPHPYGKNNQCLLHQMQKLFLQLQKSDEHAIDTKQFTNSLGRGWSFKPWEQRDAHELLRCIFDTLEQIWQEKATEGELAPMEFYRGKMEDYIKCQKCGNEEIRSECFLDIPLAVRNFVSAESFKNIGESLSAYLKPQQLEDEYCEHCHQGGGLYTGFRILEFPRILTLHLKRFDMDWKTKQRYKLNDRIEFDDYMDLNKYIHKKGQNDDGYQKELDPMAMDCSNNAGEKTHAKEDIFYELFAVITHGGSSNGGHYFAYIKNLDTDRWLCFNDSSVSFVTFEEVKQNTFGTVIHEKQQQYFGESTSSLWPNEHEYYDNGTNAYVLMYRKAMFDESKRVRFMSELPTHLTTILEAIEKDKFMKSKNPSKNRTKVSEKIGQQNIKCATEVPVAEKNSTQNPDYDQMESAYNDNQMGAINQNYYVEEIDETSDVAFSKKMEKNVAQNQNIEKISAKEFAKSLLLDQGNNGNKQQNCNNEPWLLGNDVTLMEKWKKKKILDLISDDQCLLDLTMDLIKKLEHLHIMIRPSAQMLRSRETWSSELKINCEKLYYDLSPFAYGKIFAFDSMHYALLTHQGRRLFTNWISFLMLVSSLLKQKMQ